MNHPAFWDGGLRFVCTQCSRCCRHDAGFVFLSAQDLARLSEQLDLSEADVVAQHCVWSEIGADAHLSLAEQANNDCVFWRDGGCSVYAARPAQCRTYPFWQNIIDSASHWTMEAGACPGIGIGPTHSSADVAEHVIERRSKHPILRSEWEAQ